MSSDNYDQATAALKRLLTTMQTLRAPEGCDWDRQQTPDSLKKYIIEEAYEVIEAIDNGDPIEICEELGDLLLQVVFQAQIFCEKNLFDITDVADAIDKKLKRRHPHIFAGAPVENREAEWERIKTEERAAKGKSLALDSRIPQALPALKRAEKLAALMHSAMAVEQQPANSLHELLRTLSDSGMQISEQVFGDLLYKLTAHARTLGIDAEEALRLTVDHRIKEYEQGAGCCPDRI